MTHAFDPRDCFVNFVKGRARTRAWDTAPWRSKQRPHRRHRFWRKAEETLCDMMRHDATCKMRNKLTQLTQDETYKTIVATAISSIHLHPGLELVPMLSHLRRFCDCFSCQLRPDLEMPKAKMAKVSKAYDRLSFTSK